MIPSTSPFLTAVSGWIKEWAKTSLSISSFPYCVISIGYIFFGEMVLPLVDDDCFQIVFEEVKVVFHPLLALGLHVLVNIEFDLVLSAVNVLLFDVVLVSEFLEP